VTSSGRCSGSRHKTATKARRPTRVFFPLEARSEWIWYQPTTPDNALEYAWSAEVENGGSRYEFGFFLFKYPGRAPRSGDFGALVRAGQISVATAVGTSTDTRMILLPNGRLHVALHRFAVGQGFMVVSIDDPETLRTLFSERPPLVTLTALVPGTPKVTRSVEITYSER